MYITYTFQRTDMDFTLIIIYKNIYKKYCYINFGSFKLYISNLLFLKLKKNYVFLEIVMEKYSFKQKKNFDSMD